MKNWFKISFAQIGVSATFYYIADKILRSVKVGSVYPYYFFSQPVAKDDKKIRVSKNIQLRQIEPDCTILPQYLPQSICQYRFKQNAICIGAFREEKLTAFLWFTPGTYQEDEVRADFKPPEEACWDFGVHIEPEYRMTRIFSNLWIYSTQIMKERGFKASLSRISAFNPGSLKAHTRMGARLLAKAVFINIGPLQITFSTMVPRIHISFSSKSRVIFDFRSHHL